MSEDKINVPRVACGSCPYRRDTPSGVWAAEHYELLREMDSRRVIDLPYPDGKGGTVTLPTNNPNLATFHCHQENATGCPTICRGWLSVERHSIGARLLVATGAIDPEDVPTEDESDIYYSTGTEASEAGLVDIEEPGPEAERLMQRLMHKGAGRHPDDVRAEERIDAVRKQIKIKRHDPPQATS